MMAGHWCTCSVLVAITLSLLQQIPVTTSLTFKNNQYEDLLVAIHPTVKQHPRIINELIAMFTSGSTYLFRATKNRAYFGKVNILIPNTWNKDPSWSLATSETFKDADIRVDRPHVSHGSDPYTFQPGLCGEPGKYIHFTPGCLLDEKGDREANYGNIAWTVVHEFAHLRYGVFDEYGLGTEGHPYMYLEDYVLRPTACGNTIHQGIYNSNCTISDTSGPDNGCYFIPDRDNTVSASIMYDPSVNKVTHFCESDSDDPDLKHNSLAPNQHNKMCSGKGAWDVIKEHPDFKGGSPHVNMTSAQLRPSFSILYQKNTSTPTGTEVCGRPVVLVLDLSGSMNSTNVYHKQIQTADKLIRDVLPVGTKVGVVACSLHVKVLIQLTSLLGPSDRDRVAKTLHSVTAYHGKSGIGKGLMLAKKMLESAGEAKEGKIVLITDGEENVEPYINAVKREMRISGVRVNSLVFGTTCTDASVVRELFKETGGHYVCVSENSTSAILDSVIHKMNKDISICNHRDRIEIMRKATRLFPNREIGEEVTIDSTLGHDTLFVFTLPHNVHVDVILTSPDGQAYTPDSKECSLDSTLNIVRFQFERAQTGIWHYTLSATTFGMVTLVVKALPGDHADPYEVDSWLSSMFSDTSYGSKPTVVYVHVHKGYSPVTDADVTVTMERSASASLVTLTILDNGILPDNMANDGVYSTYLTQFKGNGLHSLDVVVQTIPRKTMVHLRGPRSYGGAISRYHNTTTASTVVQAENFTRTTSPGAIDVTGFVPNKDNFAPSRVTDLAVTNTDLEHGTVTLTWTAPGDDLATGTANRYELRMSHTSDAFKAGFTSLVKVELRMIMSGSLPPKVAGTKERMVIETPANWTTIFFALKAYDEVNHESALSNIVTATFKEVKLHSQTTTTSPKTTSTTPTTAATTTTTTSTTTIITTTINLTTSDSTTIIGTPVTKANTAVTTTTTTTTTTSATTTATTSASMTAAPTTAAPTTADTTPATSTSAPSTTTETTASSVTSTCVITPTTTYTSVEIPNNQQTVVLITVSVGVLVVVCVSCLIIVALVYSRRHKSRRRHIIRSFEMTEDLQVY